MPHAAQSFDRARRNIFKPALKPAIAALCLAVLTACGGGGSYSDTSPVAVAQQYSTSYAAGTVAGFGSIVINGVHYDETAATVTDDDGRALTTSDIKLGMVAEVQATDFATAADNADGIAIRAKAQSIVLRSLMLGPVSAIDTAAGTFTVLGQTISVDGSTFYDSTLVGGMAALQVGDVVKVFGLLPTASGGTASYAATRVEPAAGAAAYSLRGQITAYDATAMTAVIGGAVLDLTSTALQTTLEVGSLVRMTLQLTPGAGAWVALAQSSGAISPAANEYSDVTGLVTEFTSPISFKVDGFPVNASTASLPSSATLVLGVRVHLVGPVVNGVLMATRVSLPGDTSFTPPLAEPANPFLSIASSGAAPKAAPSRQ